MVAINRSEFDDGRCDQRRRDLALMRDPNQWPAWPWLCLRRERTNDWPELGLLYDAHGRNGRDDLQTTVFLMCIFDLADKNIRSVADLLAQPHENYPSFAAILEDHWEID